MRSNCARFPSYLGDDERPLVEKSYMQAQNDRVGVNGFLLRVLVEFHVGRQQGRW